MEISGLEDEFRLAAGKPMLLYLKRPAPDQEPGLTAMIEGIREAGAASYRHFATARELERRRPCYLAEWELCGRDDQRCCVASIAGRVGRARWCGATGRDTDIPVTDIEGSTRLWESEPEAMEVALQRHDHGGAVVTSRAEGDSFFAVFHSAVSAVEAAGACQLQLEGEVWPANLLVIAGTLAAPSLRLPR